jgi:uncharacterized protein (DUF362 family)
MPILLDGRRCPAHEKLASGRAIMTRVAIAQDRNDIGAAIERALSLLALEPVIRGRLVAIKPNETWASPEDTTAVTQGDTLRAVIRSLRRLGPRALVVTGGGECPLFRVAQDRPSFRPVREVGA